MKAWRGARVVSWGVVVAVVCGVGAAAGQAVPDAAQMAGMPLATPELPDGVVTVRLVREQLGNNIAGHPVTLRGRARAWTATTDGQGRASFADVPAGTRVRAEATVEGEVLASQEFAVPARGGVRVVLVAGLAAAETGPAPGAAGPLPPQPGTVVIGGDSRLIFEFQGDELRGFYLLDVVNPAPAPVDTGGPLIVDLPTGAARAALLEGSAALATVRGGRLTLAGPFPPGVSSFQVGFAMPYRGQRLRLAQTWPAVVEELLVAVQKVGDLSMRSPQFTAQRDVPVDGSRVFLMAQTRRLEAGEPLVLDLDGLPHESTVLRDLVLALAVLIVALGGWAALARPGAGAAPAGTLEARRERLFAELVALEEDRRTGRLDVDAVDRRRGALVAELEQIYGQLDRPAGGAGLAA